MVQKLSGFAKFELDSKISKEQFYMLIDSMCSEQKEQAAEVEGEAPTMVSVFEEQKFEQICSLFERAFRDGQPPFQGDLENETYKAILQRFRTFQLY